MREILFRGKHVDNGEWVYGYYVPACFGRFPYRQWHHDNPELLEVTE